MRPRRGESPPPLTGISRRGWRAPDKLRGRPAPLRHGKAIDMGRRNAWNDAGRAASGDVFTRLDKAPNSVRKFVAGQVLHVRIYFDDAPEDYKIRPAVFLRSIGNRTAVMRAGYSRGSRGDTRVTIGSRQCYISDHPVTVDKIDIVGISNVILTQFQ